MILNVPNATTFMRLALWPLFAITLFNSKLSYSLIIFTIISLIGFVPGVLLFTYFGSQLSNNIFDFKVIFIGALMVISFFLYVFRHKIKGLIVDEIKIFEEQYKKKKLS